MRQKEVVALRRKLAAPRARPPERCNGCTDLKAEPLSVDRFGHDGVTTLCLHPNRPVNCEVFDPGKPPPWWCPRDRSYLLSWGGPSYDTLLRAIEQEERRDGQKEETDSSGAGACRDG